MLQINEEKKDDVVVLALCGRLDAATSDEMGDMLKNTIGEDGTKLVLDMTDLEFISSAGLRALLIGAKASQAKSGKIVVCNLKDFLKEVFEISGFSSLFPIKDDLESALASF